MVSEFYLKSSKKLQQKFYFSMAITAQQITLQSNKLLTNMQTRQYVAAAWSFILPTTC